MWQKSFNLPLELMSNTLKNNKIKKKGTPDPCSAYLKQRIKKLRTLLYVIRVKALSMPNSSVVKR